MSTQVPDSQRLSVADERGTRAVTLAFLLVALVAVIVGSLLGPPQAFNYAGHDVYGALPLASYYQGLTLHGVLNVLIFTTYFNCALLFYLPVRELGVRPALGWVWSAWALMTIGLLLAMVAMLADRASVLYTFFPPLLAWWPFNVGLSLVVVGSLMVGAETLRQRRVWKRRNPGQVTPLAAYQSSVTWITWALAAVGLVVEELYVLIPASIGLRSGTDPLLARTLFWFTGHAIVYFWLMPAYIFWYTLLPRRAGGDLVSDRMSRLSFLVFLLFSVPVGLHHQVSDPIPLYFKLGQMALTYGVVVASLLTAFTIAASLETAGRAHGGRGWLGWLWKLPWRDPVVASQVLAMLSFIIGGATGVLLASISLDQLVHDTSFIPGHFHNTVGTATALSFLGISFWLVPHLMGRRPFGRRLSLLVAWTWFVGMLFLGIGLMWQGVLGTPRRDWISNLHPDPFQHPLPMALTGIGGVLLLIAVIAFVVWLVGQLLARAEPQPDPALDFSQAPVDDSPLGQVIDRLGAWTLAAIILIIMAYAPLLVVQFGHQVLIPGNQLW